MTTTPAGTSGLVLASTEVGAALWAAGYADRCGLGLTVAHTADRATAAHDVAARLRADSPHLDVSTQSTAEPMAHVLAAQSHTADLIVVDAERTTLARTVTARARCPLVAIPPITNQDHDLPVVVGTDGTHLAEAVVLAGLTLAAALGTGVRVVCCTLGTPVTGPWSTSGAQNTFAVTDSCAEQYPDVPVEVRIARSHPVTGLIRHARLASVLVIGSEPTGDHSTSHHLLNRSPTPVALIGPLVPAHRKPVPLGCCPAAEPG
ncbi:adenine nucleotide alpha hydrolase family protein [Saccharothrix hoggarensis]|uniref:Universal stress protein family protein n=1 Tax=Saccharothrix hoggarensis TaxID=913853 RepID=A0ABW3QV07_9PSEU